MEATSPTDCQTQIRELEIRIANLKQQAINELKFKLVEARNQVFELQRELARISGEAPDAIKLRTPRRKLEHPTIAQIVEAIKGGATNYSTLAKTLNCAIPYLKAEIKTRGKQAKVVATGAGPKFILKVK